VILSGVRPDLGRLSESRTIAVPNLAVSRKRFRASILLRRRACIFNNAVSSIAAS